jgi:hypothetical protein
MLSRRGPAADSGQTDKQADQQTRRRKGWLNGEMHRIPAIELL